MARFYGNVGYGESQEIPANSGIWKDVITERAYYGDVIRDNRKLEPNDGVNSDISVERSISIIADEEAIKHWHLIKYVEWAGERWTVPSVDLQRPRLILRIGKVYNGPIPIPEEEEDP